MSQSQKLETWSNLIAHVPFSSESSLHIRVDVVGMTSLAGDFIFGQLWLIFKTLKSKTSVQDQATFAPRGC